MGCLSKFVGVSTSNFNFLSRDCDVSKCVAQGPNKKNLPISLNRHLAIKLEIFALNPALFYMTKSLINLLIPLLLLKIGFST